MSTKNKLSRIACAIGATTCSAPACSVASPVPRRRSAGRCRWPSLHLIGLTTPVKHLSESLKAVSGGDIQLRYYEPGELVPPFEIMDAVSSGKYPAGYTGSATTGTIPALPLYSGAPFNMEPPAHRPVLPW